MSYCRFQNTNSDLSECLEALNDRNISSNEERFKARIMLINFLNFCTDEGIIERYNMDIINNIINECEQPEED